jgi:hypothetical protein
MDRCSLVEGDLGGQMGRAAEAIDAETTARWEIGPAQGPITDDPGAQKRCRLLSAEYFGDGVGVTLVDDSVLGIAAVLIPPGEGRLHAEVLLTSETPATFSAGVSQPGNANPIPDGEPIGPGPNRVDQPDDLVTRDNSRPVHGEVTLDDVQVGATDPADQDSHPDLALSRSRRWDLGETERTAVNRAWFLHLPGPHLG